MMPVHTPAFSSFLGKKKEKNRNTKNNKNTVITLCTICSIFIMLGFYFLSSLVLLSQADEKRDFLDHFSSFSLNKNNNNNNLGSFVKRRLQSEEEKEEDGGNLSSSYEPKFTVEKLIPTEGTLYGSEPIAVLFNLPVIPLGADIQNVNNNINENENSSNEGDEEKIKNINFSTSYKMPFTIKANNKYGTVQGRGYWVTTSIYRWEPVSSWPTDLTVEVSLSEEITSASGQKIDTKNDKWKMNSHRTFFTQALQLSLQKVYSKMVEDLLDGKWSSTLGPDSAAPLALLNEIPQDGNVTLCFQQTHINIKHFTNRYLNDRFLHIIEEGNRIDSGDLIEYAASECIHKENERNPFRRRGGLMMGRNADKSNCMSIAFPTYKLRTGAEYTLKLKDGYIYSDMCGPYNNKKIEEEKKRNLNATTTSAPSSYDSIKLTGNRVFGIYGSTYTPRISYRRMLMHLVHGLAEGVSAEEFKKQLSLVDEAESPVDFHGELVDKTTYMILADFLPNRNYTLNVKANKNIKDKFNMTLQSSSIAIKKAESSGFWMSPATPSIILSSDEVKNIQAEKNENSVGEEEESGLNVDMYLPYLPPAFSPPGSGRWRKKQISITPLKHLDDPQPSDPFIPSALDDSDTITVSKYESSDVNNPFEVRMDKVTLKNVEENPSYMYQEISVDSFGRGTMKNVNNNLISVIPVYTNYAFILDGEKNKSTIVVEVLNITTNTAVQNAAINFFLSHTDSNSYGPPIPYSSNKSIPINKNNETCYTNSEGVCEIALDICSQEKLTNYLYSAFYTVKLSNSNNEEENYGTFSSEIILLGDVCYYKRNGGDWYLADKEKENNNNDNESNIKKLYGTNIEASLTTDRGIYKPGDTFAVMGYVVAVNDAKNTVCRNENNNNNNTSNSANKDNVCLINEALGLPLDRIGVAISYKFREPVFRAEDMNDACYTYITKLDKFGAFSYEGIISPVAVFGTIFAPEIGLFIFPKEEDTNIKKVNELVSKFNSTRKCFDSSFDLNGLIVSLINSPSMTIADPRPPSVILNEHIPHIIAPLNDIHINGSVVSYTGNPLQSHQVTVTYSISNVTDYGVFIDINSRQPSLQEAINNVFSDDREIFLQVNVTTDNEGNFDTILKLKDLVLSEQIEEENQNDSLSATSSNVIIKQRSLIQGEKINVKVETIGLFGDAIKPVTGTIVISSIPYYLNEPNFSPERVFPGVPFSVRTSVSTYNNNDYGGENNIKTSTSNSIEYTILRVNPEKPILLDERAVRYYLLNGSERKKIILQDGESYTCPRDILESIAITDETNNQEYLKKADINKAVNSGRFSNIVKTCSNLNEKDDECVFDNKVLVEGNNNNTIQYVIITQLNVFNANNTSDVIGYDIKCNVVGPLDFLYLNDLKLNMKSNKDTYNENEEVFVSLINPFVKTSLLSPKTSENIKMENGEGDSYNDYHAYLRANNVSSLRMSLLWVSSPLQYKVYELPILANYDNDNAEYGKENEWMNETFTFSAGVIPPSCKNTCHLTLTLASPTPAKNLKNDTKTDLLFNAKAPFFSTSLLSIRKKNAYKYDISNHVNLTLSDETGEKKEVFRPNEKVYLDISVDVTSSNMSDNTSGTGDNTDEYEYEAEVTYVVVDKSMLDIQPFNMMDASSYYYREKDDFLRYEIGSMLGRIASYEGMLELQHMLYDRLQSEPWLNVREWPILPNTFFDVSNIKKLWYNIPKDEHLRELTGRLTPFPYYTGPPVPGLMGGGGGGILFRDNVLSSTVMPVSFLKTRSSPAFDGGDVADSGSMYESAASMAAPGNGQDSNNNAYLRKDYKTLVALDTVVVKMNSENNALSAQTYFTLPDNTGTFVIRAYAVLKKTPKKNSNSINNAENTTTYSTLHWGAIERSLQSKLPMYIKEYIPRIIRSKDVGLFGVVLYTDVDEILKNKKVSVQINEVNGVSVQPEEKEKTINVNATTEEILFKYNANQGVGEGNVTFSLYEISENGNERKLIDLISQNITIEPYAPLMTVSTSRVISPQIYLSNITNSSALHNQDCDVRSSFASEEKYLNIKEGVRIPPIELNIGGLRISASIGYVSGILTMVKNIIRGEKMFTEVSDTSSISNSSNTNNDEEDGSKPSYPSGQTVLFVIYANSLLKYEYSVNDASVEYAAKKAYEILPKYFPPPQYAHLGFLPLTWDEMKENIGYLKISYSATSFAYYVFKKLNEYYSRNNNNAAADDERSNINYEYNKTYVMTDEELRTFIDNSINFDMKDAVIQKNIEKQRNERNANMTLLDYVGINTIASLRYFLGSDHSFNLDKKEDEEAVSFDAIVNEMKKNVIADASRIPSYSLYIIDTIQNEKLKTYEQIVAEYLNSLTTNYMHIRGRTAFIGLANGYALPYYEQSLILDAWAKNYTLSSSNTSNSYRYYISDYDAQIMSKIATYVSESGGVSGGYWSIPYSGNYLTIMVRSLHSVDTALNNTANVNMNVIAKLDAIDNNASYRGNTTNTSNNNTNSYLDVSAVTNRKQSKSFLMYENFTTNNRGPYVVEYDWNTLVNEHNMQVDTSSNMSSNIIDFYAKGEGSVMVNLAMNIVLNDTKLYANYAGILVEKIIRRYDRIRNECVGEPISSAISSEYVCITVTITTKDSLNTVVVQDLSPAGLEPLDPRLFPVKASPSSAFSDFDYFYRPYYLCLTETKKDSVTWKCPYVSAGTREYTYITTANLPGIYAVPPANAYEVEQSATMGSSAGEANSFAVLSKKEGGNFSTVESIYEEFNLQQPETCKANCTKPCPSEGCAEGFSCDPQSGECVEDLTLEL